MTFFDPIKNALDFLAIQADSMRGKTLEIGFLRSKERLRVIRLIVDKEAQKAFYTQAENEPLKEITAEQLLSIGGVKLL
jgi:hypothetical protein